MHYIKCKHVVKKQRSVPIIEIKILYLTKFCDIMYFINNRKYVLILPIEKQEGRYLIYSNKNCPLNELSNSSIYHSE